MSNDHYTRSGTFPKGNLARGDAVQSEFDAVETGFDNVETELDQTIRFTGAGMAGPNTLSENAAARADKVLHFDDNGDPELIDAVDLSAATLPISVANGGTGSATAGAARTALGVEIGVDVQAEVVTTRGDLVRGDSSGDPERLGLGTNGQYLVSDGSDATWASRPVLGTAVDVSSGSPTEVDFTGLPSWIQWIKILFFQVSLSGTDDLLVQIGDSVGIEATGYNSRTSNETGGTAKTDTTGFIILLSNSAHSFSGVLELIKIDGNQWVSRHQGMRVTANNASSGGGDKELSGTLTQVRVTRTGSDTIDGSKLNILYG